MDLSTVTLESFLGSLERVPWLEHLDRPTARDTAVCRLPDWDEWPGPEDPDCLALYDRIPTCYDGLLDQAGPLRGEAETLFEEVRRMVFERAKGKVPFDPGRDAWHGPTQCVWDVFSWAGLVAVYLLLGQTIPAEVRDVWSWVAAGHWPCGYDKTRRLMVY